MKKTLAAIGMATALLLAPAVVPAAVSTTANAASAQIWYKCTKYDWFWGYRENWTTEYWRVLNWQSWGWTCYCVGTI